MINRKLIRHKVVQVIFSHYLNNDGTFAEIDTELNRSLSSAYDLYNAMLLLLVEISRLALRQWESQNTRAARIGEESPSRKFVDNRFIIQLEGNRQLQDNRETQRIDWSNEEEFVRTLFAQIQESDFYADYMQSGEDSYEEDRELWRQIYRQILIDNEALDDVLEDFNLYWNDDRFIIDTFILKTINRFTPLSKDSMPLIPEYRSQEDYDFAISLAHQTMDGAQFYQKLIAQNTHNWDVERIPLMDRIILQVALAEIASFPSIPVSVSITEYIDIAKEYSTPNSGRYINATLDNISKKLINEKKLIKSC